MSMVSDASLTATALDALPSRGRTAMSLLAAVSLFAGMTLWWVKVLALSAAAAGVISVGFFTVLGLAIAILLARSVGALRRLDVAVLCLGVVMAAAESFSFIRPSFDGGNDEYYLGRGALQVLLSHHDPYKASFPFVASHGGLTPLLGGGVVTRYDYPPFSLEVGWVFAKLWHPLGQPQVVMMLAVIATTVILFLVLPRDYRALAVPLLLGLALYSDYAASAFTSLLALPLLCLAVIRWTEIGAGGRLTARHLGQAVALGLAASTHQLAWLFAGFFLVALWRVRRGALDRGAAARVSGAFLGVAVLTFLMLNAPFLAVGAHAWLSAVSSPFTQHVWPYGVGLSSVITTMTGHSGALQFLGYATILWLVTLLVLTAVGIRRVGPIVPLFATAMFAFSARATADYFEVFVPVWFVWAVTTNASTLAAARPLAPERWLRRISSRPAASFVLVAAFVPSFVVAMVAVLSPAPLTIGVSQVKLSTTRLLSVTLQVRNRSDHTVRPSFYVDVRGRASAVWKAVGGRPVLDAGQSTSIELVPLIGSFPVSPQLYVYGLADDPGSISSTRVHLDASQIELVGEQTPATAQLRACAVSELEGGTSGCSVDVTTR